MYFDKSQKCGFYLSKQNIRVPLGLCNILIQRILINALKYFAKKSANFICFYLKNILLSQRKHLAIVS